MSVFPLKKLKKEEFGSEIKKGELRSCRMERATGVISLFFVKSATAKCVLQGPDVFLTRL